MSETWVDYKNVKGNVSVLDVLHHFGIELAQAAPDQYRGTCPLPQHAGDRNNQTAFSVNTSLNSWKCFTHCGSGNVIALYAYLSGLNPENREDFRNAALQMQGKFMNSEKSLTTTSIRKPIASNKSEKKEKNMPLKIQLTLKHDIPFLTKEKLFPLNTIKEFGVGYCSKGMFAGRVVVPIHNKEGELIAYAGRGLTQKDINARGKWMFPKGFSKMLELYNFNRIKDRDLSKGLVLVEGFWSVIRFHLAGIPAVGSFGHELSEEQEQLIYSVTDKVLFFYDNDSPGLKASQKIVNCLLQNCFVKLLQYPEGDQRYQPEQFSPDQLRELVYGI